MHKVLQIGPKPLVGKESPEVAKDRLERMENCFRAFRCTEDQRLEAVDFCCRGWCTEMVEIFLFEDSARARKDYMG